MTRVGILVNPSAARDIRRLVARASSLSITDRCAMVRRMLVGMGTMGVDQVLMMFDQAGIAGGVTYELESTITNDESRLPEVRFLEMPVDGVPEDTLQAVRQMRESGVQVIVVLGGDGTHRLVAHECGSIPLVCVSTGTNNAFPQHYEATVVGLAAGAIAMGGVPVETACHRSKRFACTIDSEPQIPALVDICVTTEQWVGARALWRPEHLRQLFLTFAEHGAIGLSAIGSLIQPVPRWEDTGLWVKFDEKADRSIYAPIAPGLIRRVGIDDFGKIGIGQTCVVAVFDGTIAFDGEKEVELSTGNRVEITLLQDGPWIVDVATVMKCIGEAGLLTGS
jgi:predicted polyphosphate/ATP-dependent NAD kinase